MAKKSKVKGDRELVFFMCELKELKNVIKKLEWKQQ